MRDCQLKDSEKPDEIHANRQKIIIARARIVDKKPTITLKNKKQEQK